MDDDISGEFSDDGLDDFEASGHMHDVPKNKEVKFKNKDWDEGFDVSQDFSVADSFDLRNDSKPTAAKGKEKQLKNDPNDLAIDVSQSMDPDAFHVAQAKGKPLGDLNSAKDSKEVNRNASSSTKSTTVKHNHHDEEMDFSNSGSDDSIDTRHSDDGGKKKVIVAPNSNSGSTKANNPPQVQKIAEVPKTQAAAPSKPTPVTAAPISQVSQPKSSPKKGHESSSEEDYDHEESAEGTSYEQIDGAYNPKDYANLQAPVEVKELFQYIERYKPQEVELGTQLRCFIPDYLPAIGEMDAFIKIPRPDGKEDELGLKVIDEPAAYQSDPVVLELQLRAGIKRAQLGEASVRSIENSAKNPAAIDNWINSIKETHRIKPPPQVHYRKNMPDIDKLMDVWPEAFEKFLENSGADILPSPDLDMSLAEYVKVLCSILDIPVYDNPIESLHLMFTLFQDFRNNPHFQARLAGGAPDGRREYTEEMNYGAADVLEIDQSANNQYYK